MPIGCLTAEHNEGGGDNEIGIDCPSTPAELSDSSICMTGRAAMIAVLLAPTASIAKHDDHRRTPRLLDCSDGSRTKE
jgi:hypothetical protein